VTALAAAGQFLMAASGQISMTVNILAPAGASAGFRAGGDGVRDEIPVASKH